MSATSWPIIKPPHPDAITEFVIGPGPIVLNDDALDAIMGLQPDYDELANYGGRSDAAEERLCEIERDWAAFVPDLVGEIRRLRAALVMIQDVSDLEEMGSLARAALTPRQ